MSSLPPWQCAFLIFLSALTQTTEAQQLGIDQLIPLAMSETTLINEADVDTPGFDDREFIELIGEPNTALDDLVVVLYRGNNNTVYEAFDLDGFSLNDEGLFVLGNSSVANVGLVIPDNTIRNGADAIALYSGSALDFPNGTPVITDNLLDALVYGTNDADAVELLPLLLPDQPQVNEAENNNSALESMSRVPDGGAQQVTETYIAQAPTPGQFNVPACDGGTISFAEGDPESAIACSDIEGDLDVLIDSPIDVENYAFVLTTGLNQIVEVIYATPLDFLGLVNGDYRLWGVSYTGSLDPLSLEEGLPVTGIASDDCVVLSSNFLNISLQTCIPPDCLGGEITVNGSSDPQTICWNGEASLLEFESNSLYTPEYLWVLTNNVGIIVASTDENSFDLGTYGSGNLLIRGVAYTGNLDQESIQPGAFFNAINSDDCLSFSENAVSVTSVLCAFTGGCGDLIISEYVEGDVNNKAIELYNPTPFDIDMALYELQTYNNGAVTPTNSLNLSGIIPSEETYVVVNSGAVTSLLSLGDVTSNVTFFNGNDPIVLRKEGQIIDMMGIIGPEADPIEPNAWSVDNGNGSMSEHTLVRKANITEGSTDWSTGQEEWDVYPQDTFTFLGSHNIGFCDLPEAPTVTFLNASLTVVQGQTAQIGVGTDFPLNATEVNVTHLGGTAEAGVHFDDIFPQTVTLPAESFDPQYLNLATFTDSPLDNPVTVELELAPVDAANLGISLLTITIIPPQEPIPGPWYDIIEVRGLDDDFVADSMGVYCELRGVVHGLNFNPPGLSFTLIDHTAGIAVYHPDNNFGYTVQEGDSLHVLGVIGQQNGLTRIVPFGIEWQAANLDLNVAQFAVEMSESTESEMVEVRCVELVTPSTWTNSGPWFDVALSGGGNTFTARIDAESDIYGTPPPQGIFNLRGIGSQDDDDIPYDNMYLIVPRSLADFSEPVFAAFSFAYDDESGEVQFTNESTGDYSYAWSFGDGNNSNEENPVHTYGATGEYQVSLTVSNSDGSCSDVSTLTLDLVVGVSEYLVDLKVYPNPASGVLTIETNGTFSELKLYDFSGREVRQMSGQFNRRVSLDVSGLAAGSYLISVDGVFRHVLISRP